MRHAEDLDAYLRESRDSYVVEPNFCAFHAEVFGLVVWGRPGIEQARRIVEARCVELADSGPHDVVLDYRLVELIDVEAFKVLAAWLDKHRVLLGKVTNKVALIQPAEPYAAATVGGFYRVVTSPYRSEVCETVAEAESWLGIPLTARLAEIHDRSSAGRTTMTALAAQLERRPDLGVEEAAEALGLSPRTLQRRLQAEGTTFIHESRKAIVRRAKELLARTDDNVASIAKAVGFATAQHLTDVFRAEVGVPPAAWRKTTRRT